MNSAFRTAAARVRTALSDGGVLLSFESGILLALSGGADSVFLLHTLLQLSEETGFPLRAAHVEHGIRGEESRSDAVFCRDLCSRLSIPFTLLSVNVPEEAERRSQGIEETARELRYEALFRELDALPGFAYLAVAHTETDQAETILFHLLRGCGSRGASGMPLLNRRILRPLLGFTGREIRSALADAGIGFVCDSTNADETYTRNYLRNTVFPALARLVPDPAAALVRSAAHIRRDAECLDGMAEEIIGGNRKRVSLERIAALPEALLSRILILLFREAGGEMAETVHIDAAVAQIKGRKMGDIAFPDALTLRVGRDSVRFLPRNDTALPERPIFPGLNDLPERNAMILFFPIAGKKESAQTLNVYKKSKKALISSAMIVGNLFIRSVRKGDSYRYGGMTHEVRKLFASRRLSDSERERLPLLCDGLGILWIPGFGVREDADGRGLPAVEQSLFCYTSPLDGDVEYGKEQQDEFRHCEGSYK